MLGKGEVMLLLNDFPSLQIKDFTKFPLSHRLSLAIVSSSESPLNHVPMVLVG